MSCRISARAQRDLDAIDQRLGEVNPEIVTALSDAFAATCQLLDHYPHAGHAQEDLGHRLRSYPMGGYVIFYRPCRGGVEITRVLHGRQDARLAFPRRKS